MLILRICMRVVQIVDAGVTRGSLWLTNIVWLPDMLTRSSGHRATPTTLE